MASLINALTLEEPERQIRQPAPVDVIVRKAFSGEMVGALTRCLPYTIRLEELARHLGVPLQQHCVVVRGRRCALDGLVLGRALVEEGKINLYLVKDVFAAKDKPPFYLDLDAPGYQWQGRVARFLSGWGLEPVAPPPLPPGGLVGPPKIL